MLLFLCLVTETASPNVTSQGAAAQRLNVQDACSAVLSGSEHSAFIPDYWVWENCFREIAQPSSVVLTNAGFHPEVIDRVRIHGRRTIARADTARQNIAIGDENREPLAATESLLARDSLIRELPEAAFRKLTEAVMESLKRTTFTIPTQGRWIVINQMSGYVCSSTVGGREFPHLIPDAVSWKTFFGAYSRIAVHFQNGSEQFDERLLEGFRAGSRPIPTRDLQRFLQVARDVTAAVARTQQSGGTMTEVARTVLQARELLLREVSPESWQTIGKEAASITKGIKLTFPVVVH